MYDGAQGIAVVIAIVIVAGIILYQFVTNVLPWLLLAAAVIAVIAFILWIQSTKRSAHPWN
jgi:hypothetical protein